MKTCVTCKTEKPLDEFGSHKGKPGGKHYTCRSCWRLRRYSNGDTCRVCRIPVINGSRGCRQHAGIRGPEHAWYTNGRHIRKSDGYVALSGYFDHPNADHRGTIFEHVLIMSNHVGRPLIKGENVHHRNGERADNRISNLELWTTRQPKGQRVTDKVAYAREILALYGDAVDAGTIQ